MKKLAFLILLCFGIQAQAPHRFGAIDGVSIPDKVWNYPRESAVVVYMRDHSQQPSDAEIQGIQEERVCAGLRSMISQGVRARVNRELGIFASASEIEAFRKNQFVNNPDWEANKVYYRERLVGLVAGLSAVYDQGRDPQQVYQQLVAPHGVQQSDWAQSLNLGKSKEYRQRLINDLAGATPEGFAKMQANTDLRPAIEDQKRNAAIDALLAQSDSKFKTYLNQRNVNTTHPTPHDTHVVSNAAVDGYLDQKRAAWWKAEMAKLSVTLSDSSLYASCGLAAMGVTAPRQ